MTGGAPHGVPLPRRRAVPVAVRRRAEMQATLITRRSCSVNVAGAGPQQECVGVSVVARAWWGVQGELVHSHTFPTTSNSLKPLGAKCFTGVVRSAPGAA
jgi:hypothetical protein